MLTLYVAILVIVAVLLAKGIDAEQRRDVAVDVRSIIVHGLGTPHPYAVGLTSLTKSMSQVAGFYFAVLFANMWQVIYSGLYLLYDGLLTTMLVADEWNGFIKGRQTIRMSSPQGIQRSSYFLSLLYGYTVLLIIISGTLQWLISQSVFVIQNIAMAYGDSFYRYPVYDSSIVGYSNTGTIYSLIVGSLMVIALVMLGLCNSYRPREYDKKQKTNAQSYTMPLVSTCSAAISAACHRPDDDSDSHLLPVKWGFVCGDYWCLTTSRHVSYPALGPDTELRVLAETSRGEEYLQVDLGPALEVPDPSLEISSSEDLSIGEHRRQSKDTRALLPRSQARA